MPLSLACLLANTPWLSACQFAPVMKAAAAEVAHVGGPRCRLPGCSCRCCCRCAAAAAADARSPARASSTCKVVNGDPQPLCSESHAPVGPWPLARFIIVCLSPTHSTLLLTADIPMLLNVFAHTGSRRRKHQNKFEFTRGVAETVPRCQQALQLNFVYISGPQTQAWVQPQGRAGLANFKLSTGRAQSLLPRIGTLPASLASRTVERCAPKARGAHRPKQQALSIAMLCVVQVRGSTAGAREARCDLLGQDSNVRLRKGTVVATEELAGALGQPLGRRFTQGPYRTPGFDLSSQVQTEETGSAGYHNVD